MSWDCPNATASIWAGLWQVLRQTEPRSGCYDVEWDGPYYIPRSRQWHRSHFMLYDGTLFGFLEVGWSQLEAAWDLASGRLSYDAGPGSTWTAAAEQTWGRAMPELVRRLDAAVAGPGRYNRRVRRLLPLEARTGAGLSCAAGAGPGGRARRCRHESWRHSRRRAGRESARSPWPR